MRPSLARRGAAFVPSLSVYVDSVAGDDANEGLSTAAPVQTIAAAMTIGEAGELPPHYRLKRGSYWREELDLGSTDDARVSNYGDESDPLPTLDACDVVPNADFTATAGQTNVYEIEWTHNVSRGNSMLTAWENGVPLKHVATLADVEATPGTFMYDTSDPTASPLRFHVHPFGSTDPRADGNTYEFNRRSWGARGYGARQVAEGVHTTRNAQNDGSLVLYGPNAVARRCLATWGHKHNIFVWARDALVEDCAAYLVNTDGMHPGAADWTMFVAFHSDEVQSGSATFRNVYARPFREDADVTGAGFIGTGVYAHSTGAGRLASMTVEGAYLYGMINGTGCGGTDLHTVRDTWIEQCREVFSGGDVQVFDNVECHADNNWMGANQSRIVGGGGSVSTTLTDVRSSLAGSGYMLGPSDGCVVTVRNSTVLGGRLLRVDKTFASVTFTDTVLQTGRDLAYDDTVSGSGNLWQFSSNRGFVREGTTYATLAAFQAAYPAVEPGSADTAALPSPNQVEDARSFDGVLPPEADTEGRTAGSRKSLTPPDWTALMAQWDAGYLGIDEAS